MRARMAIQAPERIGRLRARMARLFAGGPMPASLRLASVANTPASLPADWRQVLAALPDPALLFDRQTTLLAFNARAAELFVNLREGWPISALSRNPDLLEGIGLIRDGAAEITVMLSERVPLERTLMATLASIDSASPSPDAPDLLITFRDLSEAGRVERIRTDFVANASHELRTPLASIIGFIETLQGAAKDDPAAREKFLSVMAMQAQRMKRLVDDLMSLSRVEMHAHVMPRDEVDLNDVVDHVREALEPLAQQEQVTLGATGLDRPALVLGDRDELVQVFQNLIHNAIRHGRKGGSVSVRILQAATGLRVQVTDDGVGIAPQHLPRLTERFYRVDVAASRKKEGTGLGLAIVKHVVSRHRGSLDIKSELGKGSTFMVTLPEAGGQVAPGNGPARRGSGRRV